MTVRSLQKFSAPSSVRKHPETFCRTFVILRFRSASLFVNDIAKSLRKSKAAVFMALNRNARLRPVRRFGRPRFLRFDGSVRGGWFSWNAKACSQKASNRRSISLIASGLTARGSHARRPFQTVTPSRGFENFSDLLLRIPFCRFHGRQLRHVPGLPGRILSPRRVRAPCSSR